MHNRFTKTCRTAACGAALFGATLLAPAAAGEMLLDPTHELLLTTGKMVKVEILEETDDVLKVNVYFGELAAPRTFKRSEIITITELASDGTGEMDTADEMDAKPVAGMPENAIPVYSFELDGSLGYDISITPVRDRLEKAREAGAEVIIIKLNNERNVFNGQIDEDLISDIGNFDDLFRAEQLVPALTSEIRADWDHQPRIVFWVERAMEGMAFIPLLKDDIYFASDGRLGGVGNLDQLFGSTGDEVVRDKQKSLRLGQVEGYAIEGGHSTSIVRAMTLKKVSLWYRLENGLPVFFETVKNEQPDGGGWVQLTDDGEDEREDNIEAIVRLEGNDALMLNAETAFKIGFSKGTVDSMDDLLFELGIEDRAYIIDDEDEDGFADDAERIGETWSRGLTSALRTLRNLDRDIAAIRPPENADADRARNAVRSQTMQLLRRAIRLARQYAEVFDPNEAYRVNLELRIQAIENEIRRERIRRK